MEEKKIYTIVGKVEIGTDEYRDLIEQKMAAESELSEYRSKYWNASSEKDKLDKKLKETEEYKNKLMEFIRQDNERYQAYVRFTAEKSIEAE